MHGARPQLRSAPPSAPPSAPSSAPPSAPTCRLVRLHPPPHPSALATLQLTAICKSLHTNVIVPNGKTIYYKAVPKLVERCAEFVVSNIGSMPTRQLKKGTTMLDYLFGFGRNVRDHGTTEEEVRAPVRHCPPLHKHNSLPATHYSLLVAHVYVAHL